MNIQVSLFILSSFLSILSSFLFTIHSSLFTVHLSPFTLNSQFSILNLFSFSLSLFVKTSISLSLSFHLAISLSHHLAESLHCSLFTVHLSSFPERSNSHSSTNTQSSQSFFRFSAFHFVQQCNNYSCSACSNGMS